jgi:transcriptional regulator with XRE-family HTH domain
MNDSEEMIVARADALVLDHEQLLRNLVRHRNKHRLETTDVADRMGVSPEAVVEFEQYDSNPTLALLRRYALAVGVRIDSEVLDDCLPQTRARFLPFLTEESFPGRSDEPWEPISEKLIHFQMNPVGSRSR